MCNVKRCHLVTVYCPGAHQKEFNKGVGKFSYHNIRPPQFRSCLKTHLLSVHLLAPQLHDLGWIIVYFSVHNLDPYYEISLGTHSVI